MVGGQSMGQLLSKDSGVRAWKHATRSAAATPLSHGRIDVPRWRETAGKDVAKFGGPVQWATNLACAVACSPSGRRWWPPAFSTAPKNTAGACGQPSCAASSVSLPGEERRGVHLYYIRIMRPYGSLLGVDRSSVRVCLCTWRRQPAPATCRSSLKPQASLLNRCSSPRG